LEYLIAYAKASGIRSGLTTNGLLLNESRALKLKESGLDFIQVSLDGSTPARNSRIRNCKESDFDLVLNGIRNSLKMGIPTNMAMLLCAETLEDALQYIELAKQLGVGIVRFCGFVPTGRGKETEITSRFLFSGAHLSQLRNFVETALQEKEISVIFDPAFGSLPPYHHFHSCNAGVDQLYLDTQGNIYPCTSMIDQQFLVGNIRTQSIEEIYKSEKMRPMCNFSEASLKGRCASCNHLTSCHGGCRGIVLAHTGNINSSFPYCLKQL
jgi:radical SAM protein with 4Fe4S-binding SPASM domain